MYVQRIIQLLMKKMCLWFATMNGLQIRGDITIDQTKRTTIITSVANVNKCISEGRDASFCYLGGASVHTNNAKAILSYHCPAISGEHNMSTQLVEYLAEGIQHHKKNIIFVTCDITFV